jgi:hypothetical protein
MWRRTSVEISQRRCRDARRGHGAAFHIGVVVNVDDDSIGITPSVGQVDDMVASGKQAEESE